MHLKHVVTTILLLCNSVHCDKDWLDEALTSIATAVRNCPKERPILAITLGNGTRIQAGPDYYDDYLRYAYCMPPCKDDPDCKWETEA